MSARPWENRLELNTMCNLSEEIVDRVTERVTRSVTRQKTIEDIRNLMINLRLNMNQAMDALNIPMEMRADVRKALGK
jgi:hypothetical protein